MSGTTASSCCESRRPPTTRAGGRGSTGGRGTPGREAEDTPGSLSGSTGGRGTPGREAEDTPGSLSGSTGDRGTPGREAEDVPRDVMDDIFGEEFLLTRPLLAAISSEQPVVLLIDEIDKTDQEFEAMLLEVLSDFQISIPELGRIEARTHPLVLLTSNNSRELTEALKRRCLYLWLDYPDSEREIEIVRLHTPELPETLARRLVEVIGMVRELDLKKPPSIAESIDWARALLLLGATDIDHEIFIATMSIIVKHRTDIELVADRVGVRLANSLAAAPAGANDGS